MHLYFNNTVPAAGFAPAPFYIEAEPAFGISSYLGFRQAGKKVADIIKHPRIGCGIGARRSAYRRLVDIYYLIYIFQT